MDGFKLGIPTFEDTAVFEPAGIYTVSFATDHSTDRVIVRGGLVTFDLGANIYTLLNPLSNLSSVVIGETDVDTAGLEITNGTLHGQFTDVGWGAGAFGTLTVTGATTELRNDWQLRIGNQGSGLFELSGGALAENGNGFVAAGAGP